MTKKLKFRFEYLATAIVLVLQIIIVYNAYFVTGWDSSVILENAHYLVTDHTYLYPDYFSQCPNNIFIMYICALIKTIVGSITVDDWLLSLRWILFFQCLLNSISGLLVFKICELRANRVVAWIGFVFYMALVGFSPWMLIAYSDAMGVIFPTLILFVYYRMIACRKDEDRRESADEKNNKKYAILKNLLPYVLIGAISAVAYNIKPQPVIVFIAIVGVSIIAVFISRKYIRLVTQIGTMAVAFLVFFLAIKIPTYYCNPNIDKEAAFGMMHYLMLGANRDTMGCFNDADVSFSSSYDTNELRTKAEFEEYKRRVSAMGVGGYTRYIGKKVSIMFSDGEFGWPAYIENGEIVNENEYFFRNMLGEPTNWVMYKIRSVMYGETRSHRVLTIVRNIFWFATLILVFAGIFLQKNNKEKSILYLALVGFVLFSILFESGERYVYVFAEVFIVTAMQTLYAFYTKVKKRDYTK